MDVNIASASKERHKSTDSCGSDDLFTIYRSLDDSPESSLSSGPGLVIVEDQDGNPSEPEIEEDGAHSMSKHDEIEDTGGNSPLTLTGGSTNVYSGSQQGGTDSVEIDKDIRDDTDVAHQKSSLDNCRKPKLPVNQKTLGKVLLQTIKKLGGPNDPNAKGISESRLSEDGFDSVERADESEGEGTQKIFLRNQSEILRTPQLYKGVLPVPVFEGVKEHGTKETTEEVAKTTTDGVTKKTAEGVTKKSTEGVTKKTTEGVTKKTTEGVTKKTTKGVTKKTTEGVTKKTTDGVTKKTTDGVTEKTTDGVTKKTTDGVTKKTTDGVTEKTTDGVTKKTTDGVTKKTTDGVTKKTTDGVTKKTTDGVTKKTTERVAVKTTEEETTKEATQQVFRTSVNFKEKIGEHERAKRGSPVSIVPVAKKSCSGRRQDRKRKYLSESDEPFPPSNESPGKKKVKKRRGTTYLISSESSDEDTSNAKLTKSGASPFRVEIQSAGSSETNRVNEKMISPKQIGRSNFTENSASSDEEDKIPLIMQLKQDAEARGIKKEMPKPPVIPKKKRHHVDDSKPRLPRKKTEQSSNREQKRRKPTLKQSNPHWSHEVDLAVKNMCSEVSKSSPNFDVLAKGMNISFKYRQYSYQKGSDIQKTLNIFPALSDYRLLKLDFEKFRTTELKSLERKLEEPLILEEHNHFKNNYISPDTVIASAKEQYKLDSNNAELLRDIQMLSLGVQRFGGQLNGALYKQRGKGEPPFKGVTPTIDIRDTLGTKSCKVTVYCEGCLVTEPPNFYEAVLCVYAIYWIFNMCYEKNAQPFFEFFDLLIGE